MRQTKTFPGTLKSPASLPGWAAFALVILLGATLFLAGCSAQPVPAGIETLPPTQPAASTSVAPSPTTVPTAAPTATPAPSNTPEPTATPEQPAATSTATEVPGLMLTEASLLTAVPSTAMPPARTTDVVTEEPAATLPVATAAPAAGGVSFTITNGTNKLIYVQGYGVTKSIPAGLTIYFQAPDWGAISFKVCKSASDGVLGGCYIYNGKLAPNNPSVLINR